MQPVNQRKNLNLGLSRTKVWTLLSLLTVFSILSGVIHLTGSNGCWYISLETYLIVNSPQTSPTRQFCWQSNNNMLSSPSTGNFLVLCFIINVWLNFMFYTRLCNKIIGGALKNSCLCLNSRYSISIRPFFLMLKHITLALICKCLHLQKSSVMKLFNFPNLSHNSLDLSNICSSRR